MIPLFLDKKLLSHKSGVYKFKDQKGIVIYVGKAIDLKTRIASYFSGIQSGKTVALVNNIASIETIIVESELEALILEANLIKKYLPAFNVRLTDDKDYLYIAQTEEDYPKIITARKMDLDKVKRFWGPFPSARTVRDTLKLLRRVFPWCSNPPKYPKYRFVNSKPIQFRKKFRKNRACFYYHLGLCPGACVGLISREDYLKIINRFSRFLDGKKEELVDDLSAEMMKNSSEERFEEASRIKKILGGIGYITQINRTNLYLENPNFLEEETTYGLEQLKKDLNLPKIPERIECYDISNISGTDATGSLVVLTHGDIDKSQYRRFKIHLIGRPNDVGMHKEMIKRRLKHPEWPMPDLIIVDGGRGQANGVHLELARFAKRGTWNLEIPVFGLAKRMEWLYPPQGEIIKLPRKSLSLKLLQKVRDESHRFAIGYHRKLRGKSLFKIV